MTNTMTAFTPARPSSPSHCPPPYFLPSDLQLDLGARINGRSPSTTPSPEVQSLNTPSPHNAPSPAINPSDHGGDAAGDAKDDEPGTADTTAPSSVRMEPSITASRAPSVMTRMREWQVIQGDLEMQARLDQEREAGQQGREEQSTGSSASANDHRSCYMCWASSPRHEQPLTSPPAVSPTLPEPTPAVATRSTTNYTGDLVESSDEYVPDRRRNWTSGPAELMTPIGSQRLSSVARREIMNIARAQARRDRAWTAGNAEDSSDEEVEYGRMGGLFHRNLYTSNAWDAYPIDNDHQHSAIPAIARPANTREAARDDREHHDNGADVNAADASNESILPSLSPVSVRDFFNYGLGFSDEEAEVLRERDDMQRQQQAAVPGQAQPAPSVADPADSPVIPNNQSSLRVSRDAGDKATAPARPMNANAGMSFQYHHAPRHQQMAHQMGQTPGQQLPYRRQAEFTGTQQITAYQPVHDFLSFSAQFGSMGLNDMLHADRGQFFAGAHAAGYDSQRQANFTGRRTAQPGSRPTSHRNAMQTPNQREHHGDRGPWRHQPVRSLDARNMQGQQHTPRLSDPFAPSYTLQSAPPVHQQYAPLPNSRPSTGSQAGGPNRQMYDTEFPALGRGGSGHPEATRRERARRTPHRHIEAPRSQQQQPKLPQLHQSAALSVNAPTFVPNNQTGALTSSGAAAHALMAYRDAQEHLEAAMREERYWQQQVQQGGNAFAILAHRAYQERGTRREIRMHPNDWLCPMPECGYHNFARNNYCKQCHLHPVTGQVDPKTEKSPPLGSPGDWKCDVCGHPNWRRREKCHGCNQGLRFLSTEYEGPGQPVYLRYVHSAHLILGNKQPPQLSELEVRIVAAMVRQVYPEHPFCQGVPLPDEAWLEPYQMGHDGSSMFPFNPMAIDAERPGGSVFDHDQYTSNALGYGTAGESSRTGAAMMAMQQGLMPSAQIAQSHSSSQHDQKETEDADDEDDEDDEEEECKSLKGKGKSKSAGSGSKGSRGSKESTGRASL